MIKLKNILNEGSADGGKMAKTHVVYAMNVKLNDKNSLGDNEVETGFRVSVKKGPDAESRAKKLAQKHFDKNFNSIIGIGKALNPEKSSISEAEEDTLMKNISFQESESLYKSEIYLNVAHNDPLVPLINKKCTKCDETIIKQILIGENYQGVFICPKCKNKFVD
jgi:formylmethanofuran dehydrogenase subunit E